MKTKRMSAVMAVIIALELVGGQMGSITTYAAEPEQATETATEVVWENRKLRQTHRRQVQRS